MDGDDHIVSSRKALNDFSITDVPAISPLDSKQTSTGLPGTSPESEITTNFPATSQPQSELITTESQVIGLPNQSINYVALASQLTELSKKYTEDYRTPISYSQCLKAQKS